jgi:hypothetical protein
VKEMKEILTGLLNEMQLPVDFSCCLKGLSNN